MKEIMTSLRKMWHMMCMEWSFRHEASVMRRARRQSLTMLQVREWNGSLYICFGGVPLLSEDDLGDLDVLEVLSKMRLEYIVFQLANEGCQDWRTMDPREWSSLQATNPQPCES